MKTTNKPQPQLGTDEATLAYFRDWEQTANFLKAQLDALCRISNHAAQRERDSVKAMEFDERAQNIRRVLVDMGEMDKLSL